MNIPPRSFRWLKLAFVLLVPLALVAVAACGGGDDDDDTFQPGRLTDPGTVPTATPWDQPPEVVILDPDNISPLPPNQPNAGEPTATAEPQAGEPGVCGDTYTVESGDLLVDIGEKCGVDWQDIAALNPEFDPTTLHPGDVLIMPSPAAEGDETQ